MMRIFLPGQKVPEWLERQEPNEDRFKMGKLTFNNICLITVRNGHYYVKGIVGGGAVMTFKNGNNITISGQSPTGGDGMVHIDCSPLFTWLEFVLLAGIILIV